MKPKYQPGFLGLFAQARRIADGDWPTAALLQRLEFRWRQKKKLKRIGHEWIAESGRNWARSAGLSPSEMKNHALPGIKKLGFVVVKHMKLRSSDSAKLIWMRMDQIALDIRREEIFAEYGSASFDEIKAVKTGKALDTYAAKADEDTAMAT